MLLLWRCLRSINTPQYGFIVLDELIQNQTEMFSFLSEPEEPTFCEEGLVEFTEIFSHFSERLGRDRTWFHFPSVSAWIGARTIFSLHIAKSTREKKRAGRASFTTLFILFKKTDAVKHFLLSEFNPDSNLICRIKKYT